MKNKLTYLSLILLSFNGIAQADNKIDKNLKNDMAVVFGEKSETRQESEKEFGIWSNKLNEYLLVEGDDFTQAIVLAKMVSNFNTAQLTAKLHKKTKQLEALQDVSYQPIADVLNQLIAKKEISASAFDILSNVCFMPEMQDHCHANVLLEKRMQQDTGNIHAYLRPFDLAIKTQNKTLMQKLIKLMALGKYSQSPLGISNQMKILIDTFITDNPIPQSAVNNMIADYQKLSGISPSKKTQLDQIIPTYMPHFIKMSFNHLNDFPPFKSVLNYCQTNSKAATDCKKIAQIMIQKSNSMLDKGVGHSLLIATYETEKNQAGIDTTKQLNDQFRQSYECVIDSNKEKYFIDSYFDPEYQAINNNTVDEFETLIQLAELRYRNLKVKDDESAVDPKSCFKN